MLGSTVGARTSSVSHMKEQILDLELELDTQTKALEWVHLLYIFLVK